MKPIKLTITAFGAFAGTETIDFTKLAQRGLFVVSGDTGTGKTTIFDAMCWALYGEMPQKESDYVRSHHVADDVRTEVEFIFECGGDRYVVTRNPRQSRPRRRGHGSTIDDPKVMLSRITPSSTELITTKVNDSKSIISSLVGLDSEQFKRVVLLPQGEFSRFLLAKSDERENLLNKLFGSQIFDEIIKSLKAKRDHYGSMLGTSDHEIAAKLNETRRAITECIEALGHNPLDEAPQDGNAQEENAQYEGTQGEGGHDQITEADADTLEKLIQTLEHPLLSLANEIDVLNSRVDTLRDKATESRNAAHRFKRATEHRARLAELTRKQPLVDARQQEAKASIDARPVVDAADNLENVERKLAAATAARALLVDEINAIFRSLGETVDPTLISTVHEALNRLTKQHERQVETLDASSTAEANLARAKDQLKGIEDQIAKLSIEIERKQSDLETTTEALDELRANALKLDDITHAIAEAQDRVSSRSEYDNQTRMLTEAENATTAASKHYDEVLRNFIDTEAPRLATQLVDGLPCPVCGSADHPHPAATSTEQPTDFDSVLQARAEHDRAKTLENTIRSDVASLRAKLGKEASTSLEALQAHLIALQSERELASRRAMEISSLERRHDALTSELTSLREQLAIDTGRKQSEQSQVQSAHAQFDAAFAASRQIDAEEVKRTGLALETATKATGPLEASTNNVSSLEGEFAGAKADLDRKLADSPHESVEAARSVLIAKEDELSARATAEALHDEITTLTSALAELSEQGIPNEAPNTEEAERALATAETELDKSKDRLISARSALGRAETALNEHSTLLADSGALRRSFETVEHVHKVCSSGGFNMRVPLTRWVLGRELDRVTDAANVHFRQMSNGRYGLRRKDDHGNQKAGIGLGLEVTDSHTGRPRSTRSLSGGEQFQASLALALGLADVVSQGGVSSGKRFEALFVDEGFGSLSADSLDDAIRTLEQLQATGRMIAAITHVEAMKQGLHVGIEVKRRADGKGSTITVNP